MYNASFIANELGIAADTLRKWAKRYDIQPSMRTQSGRYSYSDSDLVRFKLILQLKQKGFSLSVLAKMSIEEMAQKLPQQPEVSTKTLFVVGPALTFEPKLAPIDVIYGDLNQAMQAQVPTLVQLAFISEENIDALVALKQRVPSLLVASQFATEQHRLELEQQGIETQSKALSLNHVIRWLNNKLQARQFSEELLKQIDAWLPTLACECPRHLREILSTLRNFSDYCQQCSLANEQDAVLHQQFLQHSRRAEQEIERAMRLLIEFEAQRERQKAS